MQIEKQQIGERIEIIAQGRLDASWCDHLSEAISTTLKEGFHSIALNLAAVNYVSSAGIRVLISYYKQLKQIGGQFSVINPSPEVKTILALAGLANLLIVETQTFAHATAEDNNLKKYSDPRFEFSSNQQQTGVYSLRLVGNLQAQLNTEVISGHSQLVTFEDKFLGLGLGAIEQGDDEDNRRYGEFLAVAGTAAVLPADGSSKPDYMVKEQSLLPRVKMRYGLLGYGDLSSFCRFNEDSAKKPIGLSEIVTNYLQYSQADVAALTIVAETASLIGTALRKPLPTEQLNASLDFPAIREYLSFTAEPAYTNSNCLIVGICCLKSKAPQALLPYLRPLNKQADILGHFHAAAFNYVPIKKGIIELGPTVETLFNQQSLLGILHLLPDFRIDEAMRESEFIRGALWAAKATVL